MNLYHIERNKPGGYDTYSDAVVVAKDHIEAKRIHPDVYTTYDKHLYSRRWVDNKWAVFKDGVRTTDGYDYGAWVKPSEVTATLIGVASDNLRAGTVICASFHAG